MLSEKTASVLFPVIFIIFSSTGNCWLAWPLNKNIHYVKFRLQFCSKCVLKEQLLDQYQFNHQRHQNKSFLVVFQKVFSSGRKDTGDLSSWYLLSIHGVNGLTRRIFRGTARESTGISALTWLSFRSSEVPVLHSLYDVSIECLR